jgi:GMP synthase-like glutamine amidotransferase
VRLLVVVQQRDAGPGVFAGAARTAGAEVETWHAAEEPAPEAEHDAVLVLGGAMNVEDRDRLPWLGAEIDYLRGALSARTPVLGVCLGAQVLAAAAGGEVRRSRRPEIGWEDVELEPAAAGDPVLSSLPARFPAFNWHSFEALAPPSATPLARSDRCLQAFRLDGPAWGIQFHAEADAEIAAGWIRDYESDPDAVAVGLDADRLAVETAARMDEWNKLGRRLFAAFLATPA